MSATQPAASSADTPHPTTSAADTPHPTAAGDVVPDDATLAAYRAELRAVVAGERPAPLALRLGAEALGTFALVLVAVGIGLYGQFRSQDYLGPALGAGLMLAGTTAGLGRVSGGHFNPAVTLGAAVGGRISWSELPGYWVSQLVGGALGVGTLFLTVPSGLTETVGLAGARQFLSTMANGWGDHSPLAALSQGRFTVQLTAVLLLELVAAAVLVAVYLGATSRRAPRGAAPAAIGLTYAALFLLVAQVAGGGVNPARSTAVALFAESHAMDQLWLFWVAPLVGATIAGLGYLAFATPPVDEELAAIVLADDIEDDDARPGDDAADDGGEYITVEPH